MRFRLKRRRRGSKINAMDKIQVGDKVKTKLNLFVGPVIVIAEVIGNLAKGSSRFIAKIISPAYLRGGQIYKSPEDVICKKK